MSGIQGRFSALFEDRYKILTHFEAPFVGRIMIARVSLERGYTLPYSLQCIVYYFSLQRCYGMGSL